MTNGRRRPTRGAAARRNAPAGRPQQQRGRRQPPARGPGNGGYGPEPAGIGGMNPALLAGLIVIPLLLIVAIIMALGSEEGDKPVRNDTPVADTGPAVIAPPPVVHETPPDAPKYVPRPNKAEMDVLKRNWAPLRDKVKEMRRLRDEGAAFWREQDHDNAQDKFHAANRKWHEIRDTAEECFEPFSMDQIERYLDSYETELATWGKIFATFSKYLALRDD
jgi:hypothetical protein